MYGRKGILNIENTLCLKKEFAIADILIYGLNFFRSNIGRSRLKLEISCFSLLNQNIWNRKETHFSTIKTVKKKIALLPLFLIT